MQSSPTPACSELCCKDHFPRLSFCSCHPCFTCFCWFLLANSSYLSLLSRPFTAFFPANLQVPLHTGFLTVTQPLVTASESTCCVSQPSAFCPSASCLQRRSSQMHHARNVSLSFTPPLPASVTSVGDNDSVTSGGTTCLSNSNPAFCCFSSTV